jgi:RNA polymerase sigma-54 factor
MFLCCGHLIEPQALIKGLEYLLPLTQKQLALELDIGESTLSRLIKLG